VHYVQPLLTSLDRFYAPCRVRVCVGGCAS